MQRPKSDETFRIVRKPMSNHNEKPTYLTTYQKFLFDQSCKPTPTQDASETNGHEVDVILIENATVPKQQIPPAKFVQGESNSRSVLKRKYKKSSPRHSPSAKSIPQKTKSRNNDDDTHPDSDEIKFYDEPTSLYECEACSFETIYEGIYKAHMLTHKRKETFHKCPRCAFKVKCKSAVRKHMVIDRVNDEVEYCGLYAYSDECKGGLDLHMKAHRIKRNGSVEIGRSYSAR